MLACTAADLVAILRLPSCVWVYGVWVYGVDESQQWRFWGLTFASLKCGLDACACAFWFGSDLF